MNVSEGSRPFTRYSYGDFLREDRPYDVVFRLWPGTQRVLLWGDPAMAAGFGRNAGIAGSEGLEWCEPLSLKGREGTALPGPRDGYADATLSTADDWEKHAYTFRLFGRLLYDPDAAPDGWRRYLRSTLGTGRRGRPRSALASASRILPLVTSAHHPSASNNYYWPEIYTDIAIVDEGRSIETHYYDTPEPKRFGTVGPLDPEVFLTAEESARELETGIARRSLLGPRGRRLARSARGGCDVPPRADRRSVAGASAEVRRLVADVAIQAALGRFFAGKLRAGVAYERYRASGEPGRLAPRARRPTARRGAPGSRRSPPPPACTCRTSRTAPSPGCEGAGRTGCRRSTTTSARWRPSPAPRRIGRRTCATGPTRSLATALAGLARSAVDVHAGRGPADRARSSPTRRSSAPPCDTDT